MFCKLNKKKKRGKKEKREKKDKGWGKNDLLNFMWLMTCGPLIGLMRQGPICVLFTLTFC